MSSDNLSMQSLSRLSLTSDSSPRSFPQFNFLPKEIRLMIWESAISGPRIVHLEVKVGKLRECWRVWSDKAIDDNVRFCKEDKKYKRTPAIEERKRRNGFVGPSIPVGLKSKTPLPANVCQESNQLIAKKYSKAFRTRHCPLATWFDFKNDVLFLDCCPDFQSNVECYLVIFSLFELRKADRNSTEILVLRQQAFCHPGKVAESLRAFPKPQRSFDHYW